MIERKVILRWTCRVIYAPPHTRYPERHLEGKHVPERVRFKQNRNGRTTVQDETSHGQRARTTTSPIKGKQVHTVAAEPLRRPLAQL